MRLLDQVIDAHGGRQRWKGVKGIRAQVESSGLLMRMKGKSRSLREYAVAVDTDRQRTVIVGFPEQGQQGVFEEGDVRIERTDGEVLSGRENAREGFFGAAGLRRNLHWSDRDAIYYVGYAFWNYLNAPFCFESPGVEVREGEPLEGAHGSELRCLQVTYPEGFHTHCPEQSYYFDEKGRLRRHDYHADVITSFAHACALCDDHEEIGGIVFPTSRHVFPKGPTGEPLMHPTLASLELTQIEVD